MSKITGNETGAELPEKVLLLYEAVIRLIEEGVDIAGVRVSEITERAGIGKGTAYDYFDTKEEIIVCAMLFYIDGQMEKVRQDIWRENSFADRMKFILEQIENKTSERACILKFTTMLFESNQLGMLMKQKMEEKRGGGCEPLLLAEAVIKKGLEDGELRTDLPISYMTFILLTKVVAFMTYLVTPQGKLPGTSLDRECSPEQFRRYVYEGILQELCK